MTQADSELAQYKEWLRKRLKILEPVFANASIGDFTTKIPVPEKEDELTGLFVGVQIMLDTIHEKVGDLEQLLDQVWSSNEIIAGEKARMQAILDGIEEGLLTVDANHFVTYCNQAAIGLLGEKARTLAQDSVLVVALEDTDGKPVPTQRHPIVRSLAQQRRVVHDLTKGDAYYIRWPSGERRRVALSIAPIAHGSRAAGAAVALRDITDESNMDRTKSEIVSIASHQLRTPLTAVRWYIQALVGDGGLTKLQHERYLRQIQTSTHYMVQLVDSLLNVSRIDLGTLQVRPQVLKLDVTLGDVLREMAPEIEEKQLKVTQYLNQQLRPVVIDPSSLHSVLQNVIGNAIKYSPKNKEVSIAVQQQATNAVVQVHDQGIGIPAKEQSKIFTKLFRASNAQAAAPDGSGLGLYVVKAMIEQAGGTISFESVEGRGTTFLVTIPSAQPGATVATAIAVDKRGSAQAKTHS